MFNLRKCVLGVLVIALVGVTSSAFADMMERTVEISISGLTDLDLASVDLTIDYDVSFLPSVAYTLTDQLGGIGTDADDWSSDPGTGDGYNIGILSYLDDFSSQSDSFVIASLTFSSENTEALAAINLDDLSYINLVDQNNEWISDYAVETTTNGFNIGVGSASAVPEPSAFTLLAFGLLGLTQLARRRE